MISKLLILAVIFIQAYAQDYCDPTLCDNGGHHIACNNTGEFAAGSNGELVDLKRQINLIVRLHNEYRNKVAGGKLPHFASAAQMATMSWDQELAYLASFSVLRCESTPDQCHNTKEFPHSGQNLAVSSPCNNNANAIVKNNIKSWFNEYSMASPSDLDAFTENSTKKHIEHFTQMMNERSNRIGCAMSKCTDKNGRGGTYLACNYAVTNMLNKRIYKTGKVASLCKSGRNKRYLNLCSPDELYNPN